MRLSNVTKAEYYFYTHDSKILKTVEDLENYMDSCSEEQYSYHASKGKNDFADWVRGILLLPKLADNLSSSQSLAESRRIIKDFRASSPKMREVSEDKTFQTVDGYTLGNLYELYYYLRSCNDSSYYHHATASRNDFSKWVIDALNEEELGKRLLSANNLDDAVSAVRDYINKKDFYKNPAPTEADEKLAKTLEFMQPLKEEKTPERQNIELKDSGEKENEKENEEAKKYVPPDNASQFKEYTDEELEKYAKFSKREPPREDPNKKAEYLKAAMEELQHVMSEIRKHGKDTLIPELTMRMLKSKMDFYNISRKEEDYMKIISILNEIHKDLEYIAKEEQHSFAEDILKELEVKTLAMKKDV